MLVTSRGSIRTPLHFYGVDESSPRRGDTLILITSHQPVALDRDTAREVCSGLLNTIDLHDIDGYHALAGLFLTIAHITVGAPERVTPLDEDAFVRAASEWVAAYFAEGGLN